MDNFSQQNSELKRKLQKQQLENNLLREENSVLRKQRETLEKEIELLKVVV